MLLPVRPRTAHPWRAHQPTATGREPRRRCRRSAMRPVQLPAWDFRVAATATNLTTARRRDPEHLARVTDASIFLKSAVPDGLSFLDLQKDAKAISRYRGGETSSDCWDISRLAADSTSRNRYGQRTFELRASGRPAVRVKSSPDRAFGQRRRAPARQAVTFC